jgi:hypothetical protein
MNKRIIDVAGSSLPPLVQKMLLRFQATFGDVDYTITHYRDDAVFVQVYGLCDAYSVVRFIRHTPDVYLELEACTHHYWTLRMTCNEGVQTRELPERHAWAQRPPSDDERLYLLKVRADAR